MVPSDKPGSGAKSGLTDGFLQKCGGRARPWPCLSVQEAAGASAHGTMVPSPLVYFFALCPVCPCGRRHPRGEWDGAGAEPLTGRCFGDTAFAGEHQDTGLLDAGSNPSPALHERSGGGRSPRLGAARSLPSPGLPWLANALPADRGPSEPPPQAVLQPMPRPRSVLFDDGPGLPRQGHGITQRGQQPQGGWFIGQEPGGKPGSTVRQRGQRTRRSRSRSHRPGAQITQRGRPRWRVRRPPHCGQRKPSPSPPGTNARHCYRSPPRDAGATRYGQFQNPGLTTAPTLAPSATPSESGRFLRPPSLVRERERHFPLAGPKS